ncbi:sensor domain-containing diguanylate cyclase [Modestobacter sp. Leaf380]|uniref:sensor domain-containing diguanylate cyclase n=1 Tax=Modestobacter sp. Leaf380 TaxID=1736356 RepID=UPI00138F387A|nr:sensor domain-containing diguanylate cyclase [Modestobacter sp. Leaf380]
MTGDRPVHDRSQEPWHPPLPPDDPGLRERQHELLQEIDLLDVPGDSELDALTRVAATLAGTPYATVDLLDTERQCQISTSGFVGADTPRADSLCDRAARLPGVFSSSDLSLDPRFTDSPWVDGRWQAVRLYASAPLVVDGTTIGTLCVLDDRPGQLSDAQLARLEDLAAVVVALLERRRDHRLAEEARAELARTRAFEQTLLDALPAGIAACDTEGTVTLFNRESRRWHGGDVLVDLSPEELSRHYTLLRPDGRSTFPVEELPLVRVLSTGRPASAELLLRPHRAPERLIACSGVPVLDPDGAPLGAVVTMSDVTDQRALEERLRTAALHDVLTGLPNRGLLVDRLEHALATAARDSGTVAVLYCDLDGFKAVNDGHGHAAGDAVLAQTAARLAAVVRPGDTVGRIGGDEFVLVCAGVDGARAADVIARRVVAAMTAPFVSATGTHSIGVSVGIALSSPGTTPETVLTAADEDMYRVKRARRGSSRRD